MEFFEGPLDGDVRVAPEQGAVGGLMVIAGGFVEKIGVVGED